MEPATNRIKGIRDFDLIFFNLYYIKFKDMILSDFLSRQIEDDSDPHEIIPISFNIKEILKENYQNMIKDTYMVQTRSQAKAQANAPAVQSTKPATQNAIPKIERMPIKTEKEKNSKPPSSGSRSTTSSRFNNTTGNNNTHNWYTTKCQTTPKPPNVEYVTTIPNLGPRTKYRF